MYLQNILPAVSVRKKQKEITQMERWEKLKTWIVDTQSTFEDTTLNHIIYSL
jgi:hypothetical protein